MYAKKFIYDGKFVALKNEYRLNDDNLMMKRRKRRRRKSRKPNWDMSLHEYFNNTKENRYDCTETNNVK